jgi:hypothetical protein
MLFVKSAKLPKRIKLGERDYEVLGFYNDNYSAKAGTKPKADERHVVLQEKEKEAIVTSWPIRRHKDTYYEEIN